MPARWRENRRRGGFQQRNRQSRDGSHGQKGQLEAGLEQLRWIEDQEDDGGAGQQIQQPAAAIEVAAGEIERESGGGPHGRSVESGDQRVEPRARGRQRQRAQFGNKAQPQQEQQKRRQYGDVQSVDHQHVIGTGAAKMIGPDLFEFAGFADERGLHDAGGVGIALVQPLDTIERGGREARRWRRRSAIHSGRAAS